MARYRLRWGAGWCALVVSVGAVVAPPAAANPRAAAGDTRLPLSTVRFTPALSRTGTTPAGRILAVPLVVEQQPGAANRPLRHFTVEASFDDGASWKTVPVTGRTALVPNPQRPGTFASLRVRRPTTTAANYGKPWSAPTASIDKWRIHASVRSRPHERASADRHSSRGGGAHVVPTIDRLDVMP